MWSTSIEFRLTNCENFIHDNECRRFDIFVANSVAMRSRERSFVCRLAFVHKRTSLSLQSWLFLRCKTSIAWTTNFSQLRWTWWSTRIFLRAWWRRWRLVENFETWHDHFALICATSNSNSMMTIVWVVWTQFRSRRVIRFRRVCVCLKRSQKSQKSQSSFRVVNFRSFDEIFVANFSSFHFFHECFARTRCRQRVSRVLFANFSSRRFSFRDRNLFRFVEIDLFFCANTCDSRRCWYFVKIESSILLHMLFDWFVSFFDWCELMFIFDRWHRHVRFFIVVDVDFRDDIVATCFMSNESIKRFKSTTRSFRATENDESLWWIRKCCNFCDIE